MKIALIGAGNVATWIAQRLQFSEKFRITQVFSRNIENAKNVSDYFNAQAINDLSQLKNDCDIYIFALSDKAYPEIFEEIPFRLKAAFLTSGTISCQILKDYAEQYGVIYPLQTLSKSQNMKDIKVPLCIESEFAPQMKETIFELANELSSENAEISEEQRAKLHLAAVFACNFSNAMYDVAYNILKDNDISFDIMIPLIENTVDKIKRMTPTEAQTGPAARHDENVMKTQMQSLNDDLLKEIYQIMSRYIEVRE